MFCEFWSNNSPFHFRTDFNADWWSALLWIIIWLIWNPVLDNETANLSGFCLSRELSVSGLSGVSSLNSVSGGSSKSPWCAIIFMNNWMSSHLTDDWYETWCLIMRQPIWADPAWEERFSSQCIQFAFASHRNDFIVLDFIAGLRISIWMSWCEPPWC